MCVNALWDEKEAHGGIMLPHFAGQAALGVAQHKACHYDVPPRACLHPILEVPMSDESRQGCHLGLQFLLSNNNPFIWADTKVDPHLHAFCISKTCKPCMSMSRFHELHSAGPTASLHLCSDITQATVLQTSGARLYASKRQGVLLAITTKSTACASFHLRLDAGSPHEPAATTCSDAETIARYINPKVILHYSGSFA
jgi:hypothetical protein